MSKAAEMAKVSAKGSFHLLWGLVVSTVIYSVGTIFVARLLGSDLYGLYGIVLTAPALIGIFRDWGINSAMVRYTAQYRSEDRESEVRSILTSGIVFEIAFGIALSAISFVLSGYLATNIFHRPEITSLMQIASISILAGGLINAATAAFTGIEKMELNSIMLVCQSIIKTAIMITLVVLGLGTSGAVLGYTIAMVIAGLIGVALVWTQYKDLPKLGNVKLEIKAYTKSMLSYGTPLSLSAIISGFQGQFYAFLLPIFYVTDNTVIGNYGIANTFVVLIAFFATPITTMLFPAFSKLNPEKDKTTLLNVFQFSVKYASLFVVPVAALVMCLSQPAVSTLFGETYSTAPLFLALLAINYLFTALGSLSVGNFFSSQGKTAFLLYLTLISAAIGIPMGYVLILQFGVLGLIVTSIVSGVPSTIISLYWIRKQYELTVDWVSSTKILLSSALAAILTFILISELGFSSWIRLIIGIIFFAFIFVTASLLTKTIDKSDIENLRSMVSGIGIIGKISTRILDIIEKLMNTLKT
ncbi:MAG: flippase [Candidatus Bathyarchaeia archaeon]|jgi:O-antigen/teichoic acid export membrane protein